MIKERLKINGNRPIMAGNRVVLFSAGEIRQRCQVELKKPFLFVLINGNKWGMKIFSGAK